MSDLFPDLAKPEPPAPKRDAAPRPLPSIAVMDYLRPPGPLRRIEVQWRDYDGASAIWAANSVVARAIRREMNIAPEVPIFVWVGHVEIGGVRFALPKDTGRMENRFLIYGRKGDAAPLGAEPFIFQFNDRDPVTTL